MQLTCQPVCQRDESAIDPDVLRLVAVQAGVAAATELAGMVAEGGVGGAGAMAGALIHRVYVRPGVNLCGTDIGATGRLFAAFACWGPHRHSLRNQYFQMDGDERFFCLDERVMGE
jgi:hypothetical protein